MLNDRVIELAEKVWNYHNISQEPTMGDVIFVLCSNDLRVADHAVELYKKGLAPKIIFSGGIAHSNDILATGWDEAESVRFANRAIELGVPSENIIIEDKATNTGQNVQFSYDKLQELGITPRKMILVQKPFMLRRSFATFMKQWPGAEVDIELSSPKLSFLDYPTETLDMETVINTMVGDLYRIKDYAEKGFQIPQEIPTDVWSAFQELLELGFSKHLPKDFTLGSIH